MRINVKSNGQNSAEDYKWRYERKFQIYGFSLSEVELIIKSHPAIFSEIFHQRFINNVYFDSFSLKSYFANINGLSSRIKIRIRWYGDLFGLIDNPVLELKAKQGFLGKKESLGLNSFYFDNNFTINTNNDIINKSNIQEDLKAGLISTEPTLLNRYSRRYYQSANKNYRITLDSGIEYYRAGCYNNSFIAKRKDKTIVLELKYNQDAEEGAKEIINCLPFRMSKNSKYINGIDMLNLW